MHSDYVNRLHISKHNDKCSREVESKATQPAGPLRILENLIRFLLLEHEKHAVRYGKTSEYIDSRNRNCT